LRVVGGDEAVVEGLKADPGLGCLTLGEVVPVQALRGGADYVADVRFVRATSYYVGH